MMNDDDLNYHELNLKSISQMENLLAEFDPDILKNEVITDLKDQKSILGLLYMIILFQHLKQQKYRDLNRCFTGDFYKRKTPFLIGIAGAVSVGKTTFAKKLAENLHKINKNQHIEIVSADNFIYSNAYLSEHNLLEQKGLPLSFNNEALWNFLVNAASYNENQEIPIYDHQIYDIKKERQQVKTSDFLIIEGINLLELNPLNKRPFSEMIDLPIYLEASQKDIMNWFLKRINNLLDNAKPGSFYAEYAQMDRNNALDLARATYKKLNEYNFKRYIEPSRFRAQVVVQIDSEHNINKIIKKNY